MKLNIMCIAIGTISFVTVAMANAQAPAAPASGNWTKATPILRAAVECSKPAQPVIPQLEMLGIKPLAAGDVYQFPEPVTVFGTLKASSVQVFEGDPELGSSYTIRLPQMAIVDVAKAARLTKEKGEGGRYLRTVKGGGMIELTTNMSEVQLSCVRAE